MIVKDHRGELLWCHDADQPVLKAVQQLKSAKDLLRSLRVLLGATLVVAAGFALSSALAAAHIASLMLYMAACCVTLAIIVGMVMLRAWRNKRRTAHVLVDGESRGMVVNLASDTYRNFRRGFDADDRSTGGDMEDLFATLSSRVLLAAFLSPCAADGHQLEGAKAKAESDADLRVISEHIRTRAYRAGQACRTACGVWGGSLQQYDFYSGSRNS